MTHVTGIVKIHQSRGHGVGMFEVVGAMSTLDEVLDSKRFVKFRKRNGPLLKDIPCSGEVK